MTFYKTSSTLFTDVEPGISSTAANTGTFMPYPALDWTAPNSSSSPNPRDGNDPANRSERSGNPPVVVAPGSYFMFRWVDTNVIGQDGHQGIDDFSISFVDPSSGRNVTYNRNHPVGGAPNGIFEVSSALYWLAAGTPTGFAAGDIANFSEDGGATIDVPADIMPAGVKVTNNTGTYTIGGAGKMSGLLTKSNAGILVLPSANSLTKPRSTAARS